MRAIAQLAFVCMASVLALAGCGSSHNDQRHVRILNVSYDPTRELYRDVNEQFSKEWERRTGQRVTIIQSHGGRMTLGGNGAGARVTFTLPAAGFATTGAAT